MSEIERLYKECWGFLKGFPGTDEMPFLIRGDLNESLTKVMGEVARNVDADPLPDVQDPHCVVLSSKGRILSMRYPGILCPPLRGEEDVPAITQNLLISRLHSGHLIYSIHSLNIPDIKDLISFFGDFTNTMSHMHASRLLEGRGVARKRYFAAIAESHRRFMRSTEPVEAIAEKGMKDDERLYSAIGRLNPVSDALECFGAFCKGDEYDGELFLEIYKYIKNAEKNFLRKTYAGEWKEFRPLE